MTRILVTGATGFIGRYLLTGLGEYKLRLADRSVSGPVSQHASTEIARFDLASNDNDYDQLLNNIDVVIHLAGIAHKYIVTDLDYIEQNTRGTASLAEAAAKRGVRRFIFTSTIKVNGETTPVSNGVYTAITESTATAPPDTYSKSKLAAESAIISVCDAADMEYVILRPPLVYGPGVKANFLKLLQAAAWHIPVPFAGINNRRSLMYVANLCDIIRLCIGQPAAANQIYALKDHDDSIAGLFAKLSYAFGYSPWSFNISPAVLKSLGRLFHLEDTISRLTESLLIDNSKVATQLGWAAFVDTDTAIKRTVDWYRHRSS